MAVENELPFNTFNAFNDKEFQLDFFIYDKENILVTLDNVTLAPSLYYVEISTIGSSNGGRVIFYSKITGLLKVTRVTPKARTIGYSNTLNNITPSNLNYDFDRIYRIIQEIDYAIAEKDVDGNPINYLLIYNNAKGGLTT